MPDTDTDTQDDLKPNPDDTSKPNPDDTPDPPPGDEDEKPNIPARSKRPTFSELLEAELKSADLTPPPDKPKGDEPDSAIAPKPEDQPKPGDGSPPAPSAEDLKKLEGKTDEELARLAAASKEDLDKIVAAEAAVPPPGEDKPKSEDEASKRDVERILELLQNSENLEAALREAGVEKAVEIPFIKEMLGRASQSASDRTRNEIERAQSELEAEKATMATANEKKKAVFDALNKAAEDIEAGEQQVGIPTEEALEEAFEAYADGKLTHQHAQDWGKISASVYGLPEIQAVMRRAAGMEEGADPVAVEAARKQVTALRALSASVNGPNVEGGVDPAQWMFEHLSVAREELWNMAQAASRTTNTEAFENQKKLLVADHQKEIETLTARHDKALTDARAEAKAEGRAEALAEASSGALPPKTPNGTKPKPHEEEEPVLKKGAKVSDIWKVEEARAASTPGAKV